MSEKFYLKTKQYEASAKDRVQQWCHRFLYRHVKKEEDEIINNTRSKNKQINIWPKNRKWSTNIMYILNLHFFARDPRSRAGDPA